MSRASRYALRGAFILLVLIVASVMLNTSARAKSPYVSALSPLAGQAAFAANTCNGHACIGGGHHHTNCGPLAGYYCNNLPHSCSSAPCS